MPTPPRKWGTKKEASFSTASTNPNSPTRKQIWGTRSLGSSASWQGGRFFPHHCLQDLPVPKTLLQKSIGDLGYYLDGICFYVLISLEMGALNKSSWNHTRLWNHKTQLVWDLSSFPNNLNMANCCYLIFAKLPRWNIFQTNAGEAHAFHPGR